MGLAENYLCAGQLMIELLAGGVPELAAVEGSRSIKDILEGVVPTPAVLVVYQGDDIKPGDGYSAGYGEAQLVDQKWFIELIVHNHEDFTTGTGQLVEAGELMAKIMRVLAGHKLSSEHGELQRVNSSAQVQHSEGYSYYPMTYVTEVVTQ